MFDRTIRHHSPAKLTHRVNHHEWFWEIRAIGHAKWLTIYWWGSWGSEKLCNFNKILQFVSSGIKIEILLWLQSTQCVHCRHRHTHMHPFLTFLAQSLENPCYRRGKVTQSAFHNHWHLMEENVPEKEDKPGQKGRQLSQQRAKPHDFVLLGHVVKTSHHFQTNRNCSGICS